MIIKSIGRKAGSGGKAGARVNLRTPFARLIRYMTRADRDEQCEGVLWHGFYGHAGMEADDIIAEFEANAERLRTRKNGNVLYHEILSFSLGHRLKDDELMRAVTDIGAEYLRTRAPKQLAFGATHRDTDHIHLHLMVSANAIAKADREWFTKKEFAEMQKVVETYTLARYPELAQTQIYGKERNREKLKTQAREQAMKARTGEPSRKESIKQKLHGLFELAKDAKELETLLHAEELQLYTRGKSTGVIERTSDGNERRHRLSTLGLDVHFSATAARFAEPKEKPKATREKEHKHEKEPDMSRPSIPPNWTDTGPSAVEIVESEFLTGKLHEAWHSKKEAEKVKEKVTERVVEVTKYQDDVLAQVNRKKPDKAKEPKNEPTKETQNTDRARDSDDRDR